MPHLLQGTQMAWSMWESHLRGLIQILCSLRTALQLRIKARCGGCSRDIAIFQPGQVNILRPSFQGWPKTSSRFVTAAAARRHAPESLIGAKNQVERRLIYCVPWSHMHAGVQGETPEKQGVSHFSTGSTLHPNKSCLLRAYHTSKYLQCAPSCQRPSPSRSPRRRGQFSIRRHGAPLNRPLLVKPSQWTRLRHRLTLPSSKCQRHNNISDRSLDQASLSRTRSLLSTLDFGGRKSASPAPDTQ